MPLKRDEINELLDPKKTSWINELEDGLFYNFAEIFQIITKYRLPRDEDDVEVFMRGKKDPDRRILALASLFSDRSYAMAMLSIQIEAGNLIEGKKDGTSFYSRR